MNIENITDIFTRLSSLKADDVIKFKFMCENAMEYVDSHIKKNIDESAYGSRLCFAAAALAYYRFLLWNISDGNGDELTLGDISVKPVSDKQLESASRLCREAFDSIGEIMLDDGFVFERI